MSMLKHSTRAWGSPSRYIQDRYELDNIKNYTEIYGKKVFFLIDVLVQLIVEGAPAEEIEELYDFYNEVGLPTTFADLGVADVTDEELMKVAETSMHSYWDVEPFTVNPQMVFDGLKMADILGRRMK